MMRLVPVEPGDRQANYPVVGGHPQAEEGFMEGSEPKETEIDKNLRISKPGDNQIDFEEYRLSQDFEGLVGVKKETLVVPVRKPDRQTWFQVHPAEDWRITVALIETREDRQFYLVSPKIYPDIVGECVVKYLFTYQTRQGVVSLWPIKMPGKDGRLDPWNESALQIVTEHAGRWIRVASNMALGAYDIYTPEVQFDPPVWPSEGFKAIFQKAFRGKIIDSLDHPTVKVLRGRM